MNDLTPATATELQIALAKTIKNYFPKLGNKFAEVRDPRNPALITYDLNVIIWVAFFYSYSSLNPAAT